MVELEKLRFKMTEAVDELEDIVSRASGSELLHQHPVAKTGIPDLAENEDYAGIILNDDGTPLYHLILLPGDVHGLTWEKAKEWAAERGGELPNRREGHLLIANLKGAFEQTWYWLGEEYEKNVAYAWCQYFNNGFQSNYRKDYDGCRARAVRRLPI